MALSRHLAAPVLLVLLFLVATETVAATARVVSAEKHCLSQSHKFRGLCFNSANCANVCKSEKLAGGECKMNGATRKCFCKVVC